MHAYILASSDNIECIESMHFNDSKVLCHFPQKNVYLTLLINITKAVDGVLDIYRLKHWLFVILYSSFVLNTK